MLARLVAVAVLVGVGCATLAPTGPEPEAIFDLEALQSEPGTVWLQSQTLGHDVHSRRVIVLQAHSATCVRLERRFRYGPRFEHGRATIASSSEGPALELRNQFSIQQVLREIEDAGAHPAVLYIHAYADITEAKSEAELESLARARAGYLEANIPNRAEISAELEFVLHVGVEAARLRSESTKVNQVAHFSAEREIDGLQVERTALAEPLDVVRLSTVFGAVIRAEAAQSLQTSLHAPTYLLGSNVASEPLEEWVSPKRLDAMPAFERLLEGFWVNGDCQTIVRSLIQAAVDLGRNRANASRKLSPKMR